MPEYWLMLVRSCEGSKLHAGDGEGQPLCGVRGSFWRGTGFGKPTCKWCLKRLDEIVAEQTRRKLNGG